MEDALLDMYMESRLMGETPFDVPMDDYDGPTMYYDGGDEFEEDE